MVWEEVMAVYPDLTPIEGSIRVRSNLDEAYINELEVQIKQLTKELEIYKQYVTLTKFEKYPHE